MGEEQAESQYEEEKQEFDQEPMQKIKSTPVIETNGLN